MKDSDGSGELARKGSVHRCSISTDDIHTLVLFSFATTSWSSIVSAAVLITAPYLVCRIPSTYSFPVNVFLWCWWKKWSIRFKERSRVGAVAVLNVNVRHDPRKHSLHWQHSSKLLPSLDLAVVSDGMNTDEFYTVT